MDSDSEALTLPDFLRRMYDTEEDGRVRALRDLAEIMRLRDSPEAADWLERDAGRVVAEVGAKRRVVALFAELEAHPQEWTDEEWRGARGFALDTLRALALPYADHSDYRQEWKP